MIAIATVALAVYLAFTDEHERALEVAVPRPDIRSTVDFIDVAQESEGGGVAIFLIVELRNLGSPSIAEFGDLTVATGQGTLNGRRITIPDGAKLYRRDYSVVAEVSSKDSLADKAYATPIPTDGAIRVGFASTSPTSPSLTYLSEHRYPFPFMTRQGRRGPVQAR